MLYKTLHITNESTLLARGAGIRKISPKMLLWIFVFAKQCLLYSSLTCSKLRCMRSCSVVCCRPSLAVRITLLYVINQHLLPLIFHCFGLEHFQSDRYSFSTSLCCICMQKGKEMYPLCSFIHNKWPPADKAIKRLVDFKWRRVGRKIECMRCMSLYVCS